MRVVPVPVRSDNYAYLIIDETTNKAAAVDPYDMKKVQAAADKEDVQIVANLTTHHHHDHSGGNADFAAAYPQAPIYGGSEQGAPITVIVKDKDEVTIGEHLNVKCLATPCHTQDSICYHVTDKAKPSQAGAVFTGDTLFVGGCGRFFEGTAKEMEAALSYLGALPDETVTYVGHEYTTGNFAFGQSVEPSSSGMKKFEEFVSSNKVTTGRSTIGDEKVWNVFMRLGSKEIRESIGAEKETPSEAIMTKLRELKNNF